MDAFTLHAGDNLAVLAAMPDNSVDAVVTDPPYGIRFMGKAALLEGFRFVGIEREAEYLDIARARIEHAARQAAAEAAKPEQLALL